MKANQYLPLLVLVAGLAACNSGSTATSGSSSASATASARIDPIGALFATAGDNSRSAGYSASAIYGSSLCVGCVALPVTYSTTFRNTGSAALQVSGVSVWGLQSSALRGVQPLSSPFMVTGLDVGQVIEPGETAVLGVTFDGGGVALAADLNATVHVAANVLADSDRRAGASLGVNVQQLDVVLPVHGVITSSSDVASLGFHPVIVARPVEVMQGAATNSAGRRMSATGSATVYNPTSQAFTLDLASVQVRPEAAAIGWTFTDGSIGGVGADTITVAPGSSASISYRFDSETTQCSPSCRINIEIPLTYANGQASTIVTDTLFEVHLQTLAIPVHTGGALYLVPGGSANITLRDHGNATLNEVKFTGLGTIREFDDCSDVATDGVCTATFTLDAGAIAPSSFILGSGDDLDGVYATEVPVSSQPLAVSEARLIFGGGATSLRRSVWVTNFGATALSGVNIAITGDPEFTIIGGGSLTGLPPFSSSEVVIAFNPVADGNNARVGAAVAQTATLRVGATGQDARVIILE